jgi:hypothetical protein
LLVESKNGIVGQTASNTAKKQRPTNVESNAKREATKGRASRNKGAVSSSDARSNLNGNDKTDSHPPIDSARHTDNTGNTSDTQIDRQTEDTVQSTLLDSRSGANDKQDSNVVTDADTVHTTSAESDPLKVASAQSSPVNTEKQTSANTPTSQGDIADTEGMAACLLVKDDNHWLSEWLAYHYYVLPLKHLIVVKDPTSKTSPQPVFDLWKSRIRIETWEDDRFLHKSILQKKGEGYGVRLHRLRQQFFYASCLRHLKKEGASWVVLVDTDEFVRPNMYRMINVTEPRRKQGDKTGSTATSAPQSTATPDLSIYGSTLQWLRQQIPDETSKAEVTCLHVPRIQITSNKTDNSIINTDTPAGFNGSQFLTTRWRVHNGQDIQFGHNLDGKNVINVQWLDASLIPRRAISAHRIIESLCPATEGNWLSHRHSYLLIYHYLGTLEQFTYREDPRNQIEKRPKRDHKLWSTTGHKPVATIRDDSMPRWLTGFVNHVGNEEAHRLLDRVGVLE